jgi:hypothetical protein
MAKPNIPAKAADIPFILEQAATVGSPHQAGWVCRSSARCSGTLKRLSYALHVYDGDFSLRRGEELLGGGDTY